MIYGIGNDIIAIERIKGSIDKYGERFLHKVFTNTEIEYSQQFGQKQFGHLAARFAVKESFSKAIGTGFSQGFKLNEVGVVNEQSGKPSIELSGRLLDLYGQYTIHVSISHSDEYAIAMVVLETND